MLQKAEAVPTDNTVKANQRETIDNVKSDMNQCYDHVMDSGKYVTRAFPGNTAVHDEFGFNKIVSVRHN